MVRLTASCYMMENSLRLTTPELFLHGRAGLPLPATSWDFTPLRMARVMASYYVMGNSLRLIIREPFLPTLWGSTPAATSLDVTTVPMADSMAMCCATLVAAIAFEIATVPMAGNLAMCCARAVSHQSTFPALAGPSPAELTCEARSWENTSYRPAVKLTPF